MVKGKPKNNDDSQVAGHLFSASVGLIVFLVSSLTVLLATYDKIQGIAWLENKYKLSIWICLIILLIFCIILGLSLVHLWLGKVPIVVPIILFGFTLLGVFVGSIFWVLATL